MLPICAVSTALSASWPGTHRVCRNLRASHGVISDLGAAHGVIGYVIGVNGIGTVGNLRRYRLRQQSSHRQ